MYTGSSYNCALPVHILIGLDRLMFQSHNIIGSSVWWNAEALRNNALRVNHYRPHVANIFDVTVWIHIPNMVPPYTVRSVPFTHASFKLVGRLVFRNKRRRSIRQIPTQIGEYKHPCEQKSEWSHVLVGKPKSVYVFIYGLQRPRHSSDVLTKNFSGKLTTVYGRETFLGNATYQQISGTFNKRMQLSPGELRCHKSASTSVYFIIVLRSCQ